MDDRAGSARRRNAGVDQPDPPGGCREPPRAHRHRRSGRRPVADDAAGGAAMMRRDRAAIALWVAVLALCAFWLSRTLTGDRRPGRVSSHGSDSLAGVAGEAVARRRRVAAHPDRDRGDGRCEPREVQRRSRATASRRRSLRHGWQRRSRAVRRRARSRRRVALRHEPGRDGGAVHCGGPSRGTRRRTSSCSPPRWVRRSRRRWRPTRPASFAGSPSCCWGRAVLRRTSASGSRQTASGRCCSRRRRRPASTPMRNSGPSTPCAARSRRSRRPKRGC